MKVWKKFDQQRITHSMAHYLMAIAELIKSQGYCRVTDVARELEITPGAASVSLKALKKKGWVDEDPNRFLRLSPSGECIAATIHANNKALVSFLIDVLEVSPEQADIDSCKIEHLMSPETRAKLLRFLRFIHGDATEAQRFLAAWLEHKGAAAGLEAQYPGFGDDIHSLAPISGEEEAESTDSGNPRED